jgi:hypothetical protein
MVLKSYYDGSWDDDALTLCGVAATESVWCEFETKWQGVLQTHLVKDNALHMRDLMGLDGNFSRNGGWTPRRRELLITDLLNVVGSFRGLAHHLIAYSCTVLLKDWALAKERLPQLPDPHSMCVNFCVMGLHLPMECAGEKKPILLYFDEKEKFMHTVRRVWERRRKQPGRFRQIRSIEKVKEKEKRTCYPLQLADLLAWIKNRHKPHARETFVDTLRVGALLAIKHCSLYYDLDKILEHYPDGRLIKGATN